MTEETKEKIRNSSYHKNCSGKLSPMFGKKHSEETKRKISLHHADFRGSKGPNFKYDIDKKWLSEVYKNNSSTQVAKMIGCCKRTVLLILDKYNIKKRKSSNAWLGKKLPDYMLRKIFKNNNKKNNQEKIIHKLIGSNYIYDKSFIIDGLIPDFVDSKQMKIIEFYGSYWHKNRKSDKRRLQTYKKYGYNTLIIWDYELKDIIKLKKKIEGFNKL